MTSLSAPALANHLGGRGGKLSAGDAMLYAFDLLYFDGRPFPCLTI